MSTSPPTTRGGIVTGRIVTNADLPASWETSDAWIPERTGIRQHHIGSITSALGRAVVTIDKYANSSPASIPVALGDALAPGGSSPVIMCCSAVSAGE
jgi:3-oxoacyl-[acyl-carrier-protein] synthase III